MTVYPSIASLFWAITPTYKAVRPQAMQFAYRWNPEMAERCLSINPARAEKRAFSYIIPSEIERMCQKLNSGKKSVAIRFGHKKEGRGVNGDRGDFCLVGGAYEEAPRGQLTLFYRSIELIGGLHYDQAIVRSLDEYLMIKQVNVYAVEGHCFALKRNSNEKLHAQLCSVYGDAKP